MDMVCARGAPLFREFRPPADCAEPFKTALNCSKLNCSAQVRVWGAPAGGLALPGRAAPEALDPAAGLAAKVAAKNAGRR